MQEMKNFPKDKEDFGLSFGAQKSDKKGESECSYELSSDEESKTKMGRMLNEDKLLSELKKENEKLEKELTQLSNIASYKNENMPTQILNSNKIEATDNEQNESNLSKHINEFKPEVSEKLSVDSPTGHPSILPSTSPNYNKLKVRNTSPNFVKNKYESTRLSAQTTKDIRGSTNSIKGNEKCKAMELRVMGAINTIRRLEAQLRRKEESIKKLQDELNQKNKTINKLQSNKESVSSIQKNAQLQYNLALNLRKKEKEMEEELLKHQTKISEMESQTITLQNANTILNSKLNEKDQRNSLLEAQMHKLSLQIKENDSTQANYKAEFDRLHKANKDLSDRNEALSTTLNAQEQTFANFRSAVKRLLESSKNSIDLHYKVIDKLQVIDKNEF